MLTKCLLKVPSYGESDAILKGKGELISLPTSPHREECGINSGGLLSAKEGMPGQHTVFLVLWVPSGDGILCCQSWVFVCLFFASSRFCSVTKVGL